MERLVADVRHAARSLARQPGLTLTALLTLAVGIGAATAIFSIAYGVLLRPLPYPEPERLVQLAERHAGAIGPLRGSLISNLTYSAWAHATTLQGGIAAYSGDTVTLRIGSQTSRVGGAMASPALFGLLRVRPVLGRFYADNEATADHRVVVIGHSLWQSRFGARPKVLGEAIAIDGAMHTIIGIAPAQFAFPSADAQLWRPYVVRPPTSQRADTMNVFFAIAS